MLFTQPSTSLVARLGVSVGPEAEEVQRLSSTSTVATV
jgi:hypothetical protein